MALAGFYAELLDPATGAVRVLRDGTWRTSSSGLLTTVSNPSKGGVAFKVQGAVGLGGSSVLGRRG